MARALNLVPFCFALVAMVAACGDDTRTPGNACSPACSAGLTCCGGACVATQTRADHCGMCGNVCAADSTCTSRTCRCSVAGRTSCGADGCRDLQSDAQHCGTCGNACAAGQYCAAGACLCPVATPGAPIEIDTSFAPTAWRISMPPRISWALCSASVNGLCALK